jgi:LytS/YehU family sensor histidine kinase
MILQLKNNIQFNDIEEILHVLSILAILLILLFLRNFWNWIMKRNYRSKFRRLSVDYQEQVSTIDKLNLNQTKLLTKKKESEEIIHQLKKDKVTVENSFKEKEKTLRQKRVLEKEAFEKKIDDFKYERIFYKENLKQTEVKASNTRLSAHFLKNVLFKIQETYKEQQINKINVFGNLYFIEKQNKNDLLPIDVLTKINQLLDYNVSTLKEYKVNLSQEVNQIIQFLDIIKFLKPNLKITHNFNKKYKIEISPTLFFPFIENALKHGNFNESNSFLNIELIIIKNTLLYKVTNSSFSLKNKPFEKGFGLSSLEKALETYYKNSEIEFTPLKNKFIAELKIEVE